LKIVEGISRIEEPICISLGNFDGLHIAHRKLIEQALEVAKEEGLATAVLTFSPHPKEFFLGRGPERILPHHIKDTILDSMGVDYLIILPFDLETATMDPKAFIKDILRDRYQASHIFVGYNYHFGDKQMGNVYLLEDLKDELGYELHIQKEVRTKDMSVSSTAVRDLIKEGDVNLAGALLGYFPMVEGIVVEGNHLGHTIGYPTANLNLSENLLVPKEGVYMGYVRTANFIHKALINVGTKPTVGDALTKNIEAHILDFTGDIYGETIQISFTDRIRDEVKFDSLSALKLQLQDDERFTRDRVHTGTKNIALFPDSLY
jgi:riboflavin kinase/FMN adenylyltransferase